MCLLELKQKEPTTTYTLYKYFLSTYLDLLYYIRVVCIWDPKSIRVKLFLMHGAAGLFLESTFSFFLMSCLLKLMNTIYYIFLPSIQNVIYVLEAY